MYASHSRPRPILKRHDNPSSSTNSNHINNTAANTLSNSHYQHYTHPRTPSYPTSHHIYAHTPTPIAHSPRGPTVRFPPSPSLTKTFDSYHSSVYDRSPIVVAPNTCALPARGCPGRTYALDGDEDEEEECTKIERDMDRRKLSHARERDFHLRALAFASGSSPPMLPVSVTGPSGSNLSSTSMGPAGLSMAMSAAHYGSYGPVPQLVHDFSSESDESDGVSGLPVQITGYTSMNISAGMSGISLSASPSKASYDSLAIGLECDRESRNHSKENGGVNMKPHRRHRSRERGSRHERSSDPDRIPGPASAVPAATPFHSSSLAPSAYSYPAYPSPATSSATSSPSSSPPSPSSSGYFNYSTSTSMSPRKKGVRRTYPASISASSAYGFGMQEEGCLGGF